MRRLTLILLQLMFVIASMGADRQMLLRSLEGYTGYSWQRTSADTLKWDVALSAVISSGNYAPFWIHTNTRGSVSEQPFSGTINAAIFKNERQTKRWIDYSAAARVTMLIDRRFRAYPQEAWASARLYVFRITAGFCPDEYNIDTADPILTSGNLLFSRNARPIPRITVSTNGYIPFPFLFGYLEFKAGITHGWMIDNVFVNHSFLHHKYIGGRIGGNLPVNIAYEFHHAAQWGGYSPLHGDLGNNFNSFKHIFFAQNGGNNPNDQMNAEGNHLGSQQLSLIAKWKGWRVTAYWQNIFEDAPVYPLWRSVNIADGLWGLSIKQSHWPFINGVLYEFVNTTYQSGMLHDIDGLVIGGGDSYFTNGIYRNGWNFYMHTLGTPLITSPFYNSEPSQTQTLNNRIRAHHIGLSGDIYTFKYRLVCSHTVNYGNYNLHDIASNRTAKNRNTAILLSVSKTVPQAWGLNFSVTLATDIGSQFGNNFGAMLTISKTADIIKW